MAKYISDAISNSRPPITGDGAGEVLNAKQSVAVDTALAANDLLLFLKIPAGHEPVGGNVFSTDIDSNASPTVTVTVGVLNNAGTDLVSGTEFVVDSAVGKAGTLEAFALRSGLNLPVLNSVTGSDDGTGNAYVKGGDRVLAGKITNAGTTKVAGTMGVSLLYKA